MIKNLFFLILLLLTITQAKAYNNSEYSVKFGGWSYHQEGLTKRLINKYEDKNFEYNESHYGFGLDYAKQLTQFGPNHYLTAGLWYMKDSYNKDAYHAGMGYKYRLPTPKLPIDSLEMNLSITYFNRSAIFARNGHYFTGSGTFEDPYGVKYYKDFYLKRVSFVLPYPYLTVNVTKKFNLDFMALISKTEMGEIENQQVVRISEWESVFFFRMGYKF